MKKNLLLFIVLSSPLAANLYSILESVDYKSESFTLYIALFTLAIISIITLFISSQKIRYFKKELAESERIKDDIQKQHNTILANMSENIYLFTEENIDITKKIAQQNTTVSLKDDINLIENSENRVLSIATNLIEFLRLKSKKVQVVQEKLSFSNLLNDVSGSLKEIIKDTPLELHYFLDSKLKQSIYSDTLNLSKVLLNLFVFCVENKTDKLLLNISPELKSSNRDTLLFSLCTNIKKDVTNSDVIFNAHYNEKKSSYESLGLFVARELCDLMGGQLTAQNDEEGYLEFVFTIEYKLDEDTYTLSNTQNKNILIVELSHDAAQACKNVFESLNHKVTIVPVQDYLIELPNFTAFDLVLLDEMLFTQKAVGSFTPSDTIISLSNLFGNSKNILSKPNSKFSLKKPLTTKHAYELLEKISTESIPVAKQEPVSHAELTIYKDKFVDFKDVTLAKFSKFRAINILLVEDNFINQKVFSGILSKSGISISIANNGKEALDKLKENHNFDLIFMDINMPIMDGFEATKHIRKNKSYSHIPVIALSALTSNMEVSSMFDAGMNAYLAKPLKKEKLFSALSMFISTKQDERRQSVRYEERTVKLNGLNIGVGINNSNSNDFFYKEILHEFQDAYGESDIVFKNLVEDSRYEQLRMLCLDMRGLASSIGAEDMNLLATEVLKLLLFKKYEILKDFVSMYTKSLEKLNYSIDKHLEKV